MLLQANNLYFKYPDQAEWLISNISLTARSGEIWGISGDSGSGKTTLLFLLAGIIPRHRQGQFTGSIQLANIDRQKADLAQLAPHISLVMQQPDEQIFFPSVEQELAFAPENLCLSVTEIEKRISQALELLNIKDLRFAQTDKLSFGQQKLVALAAIYTLQPEILMLDEISNGLADDKLADVCRLIKEYSASGKIVILADHDPRLLSLTNKNISLN
jgi:energy-coupling factor transport system ATP-binding protein